MSQVSQWGCLSMASAGAIWPETYCVGKQRLGSLFSCRTTWCVGLQETLTHTEVMEASYSIMTKASGATHSLNTTNFSLLNGNSFGGSNKGVMSIGYVVCPPVSTLVREGAPPCFAPRMGMMSITFFAASSNSILSEAWASRVGACVAAARYLHHMVRNHGLVLKMVVASVWASQACPHGPFKYALASLQLSIGMIWSW
eukprot:scaffold305540_cov19-Tisochrysis_lutea.AAC.2